MDSLEEFIEDSIDSHGLVDRNAGQSSLSNKQLYLMLNTLITNQSAALNAEFKRLHERLDKIENPPMVVPVSSELQEVWDNLINQGEK